MKSSQKLMSSASDELQQPQETPGPEPRSEPAPHKSLSTQGALRQPPKHEVLTLNHRVLAMMSNSFTITAVTHTAGLLFPHQTNSNPSSFCNSGDPEQCRGDPDGVALRSKQSNLANLRCQKSKSFPGGTATALWLHWETVNLMRGSVCSHIQGDTHLSFSEPSLNWWSSHAPIPTLHPASPCPHCCRSHSFLEHHLHEGVDGQHSSQRGWGSWCQSSHPLENPGALGGTALANRGMLCVLTNVHRFGPPSSAAWGGKGCEQQQSPASILSQNATLEVTLG